MKRAFSLERLPLTAVILHTILVVFTIGTCLLPSLNPDSGIDFQMMVIMGYFIDFPIGMLVEMIHPKDPSAAWIVMLISFYIFIGGLYWFLIFKVIAAMGKVVKRKMS